MEAPFSTFTPFPRLIPELQLKIWRTIIDDVPAQVIEFSVIRDFPELPRSHGFLINADAITESLLSRSKLFQIDYISRKEAFKRFQLLPIRKHYFNGGKWQRNLFIDPSTDTIFPRLAYSICDHAEGVPNCWYNSNSRHRLWQGCTSLSDLWCSDLAKGIFEDPILRNIKHLALDMKDFIAAYRNTAQERLPTESHHFPESLQVLENLSSLTLTMEYATSDLGILGTTDGYSRWKFPDADMIPADNKAVSDTEVGFTSCDVRFIDTDPLFTYIYTMFGLHTERQRHKDDMKLLRELLQFWGKTSDNLKKIDITVKHITEGGIPRHHFPVRNKE